MILLPRFQDSIEKVIDYLWDDELKSFEETFSDQLQAMDIDTSKLDLSKPGDQTLLLMSVMGTDMQNSVFYNLLYIKCLMPLK